ncbi:MAG: polysaccharide biosynthesis tyrosine autokinase [Bacteroidaceae bacterium]|nr:polysaccharide biosynthesis tyrosine autokinase [Bacteroidaceae bacterium]
MDVERNLNNEESGNEFNIGLLLHHFLLNWKLFAVSVAVCLFVALFYVYNATKIYQVSAKILLQDADKGSFASQMDFLSDFGYQGANSNVENEIEVINSMSVVSGAVANAGLYISYSCPKFIGEAPIYKAASPVNATIQAKDLENLRASLQLELNVANDTMYTVSYKYENELEGLDIESEEELIEVFPYLLQTEKGNILLTKQEGFEELFDVNISIAPLKSTAAAYKGSLGIAPISKTASVAIVATNTAVPGNGIDFISALIESYNNVTNEDKRQVARDTELFIKQRIDVINGELTEKEKKLANYKQNNQLLAPEIDAPQVLRNKEEYVKKMEEMEVVMENSKFLNAYVNNPKNDLQSIPSTMGLINDPSLSNLIVRYNSEVSVRNQLLLTATVENPALKSQTETVRALQGDIREALAAFDKSLEAQYEVLKKLADEYTSRLKMSPEMERSLVEISRERDIKSQLYVMLLQKYEENALQLAVTANNLRCIDPAMCSMVPVAPRKNIILLAAIFIGVLLPSLYIYIKELLRTKIVTIEEVQAQTTLPIVATIPVKHGLAGRSSSIVVRPNSNDVMAEAFRTLRTNLQFVMKKTSGNVIMFTSTVSGEGKTFVSSNFAVSAAMLGKKVLMMGVDIRRPRLAEVFNIDPKAEGITSYLCADENEVTMLDKLILPSTEVHNLYLLPAGIVPPNPAELLSKSNLDIALNYLSKKFDYVIMDTAPVGLVSDSLILSRVADAVVYVSRIDYTERSSFEFLNGVVKDGKLENVSVVVNGDDLEKRKRTYGYTSNGYSYGYSYSSDTDSPSRKKKK